MGPGTPIAIFNELPPARQQQLIIEILHTFIQDERRRNYHFLGNHSHRYMDHEDLLNVAASDGQFIFTKCYPYEGQDIVRIEVSPSLREPLTIDNLTIAPYNPESRSGATITAAADWLRVTYLYDNTFELRTCPEEQYEEQQRWWEKNAKTFPLLSLPAELRETIYLHALGPVILPEKCDSKITLGQGIIHKYSSCESSQRDPDVNPPDLELLKVSKQVRKESIQVAIRDTTKRFRATHCCLTQTYLFMNHVNQSVRTGFLRVIQLELTARQYFQFIGVRTMPLAPLPMPDTQYRGTKFLKTINALKELDFRFISPKHEKADCPWSNKESIHSCQRIWISWFFTLAWDALRDLIVKNKVKISLSGCVKTSTRRHWQKIFDTSRLVDYTPDMVEDAQQICAGKTDYSPIPCHCSNLCGRDPNFRVTQWSEYEVRRVEGLKELIEDDYWSYED